MSNLSELCLELQRLREEKEKLEQDVEDKKKGIRKKMDEILEVMVDTDTPGTTVETAPGVGFNFKPKTTTHYSKLGEEKLSAAGLVFFDVLRNNGLGYLIQETVNSKSMDTAFRNAAAENKDVLPEELAAVCTQYDVSEVRVTKASKKDLEQMRKLRTTKGGTL